MQHISLAEFRSINWLPTKERVHQCINAITFKFVNKNCLFYLNEIFEFTPHCIKDKRNSFAKLKHPFRKTNTGQKTQTDIAKKQYQKLDNIYELDETIKNEKRTLKKYNKSNLIYNSNSSFFKYYCDLKNFYNPSFKSMYSLLISFFNDLDKFNKLKPQKE